MMHGGLWWRGQTSVLDPAYKRHILPTPLAEFIVNVNKNNKHIITIKRVSFEFLLYVKKTSIESPCKVCIYSDNPF